MAVLCPRCGYYAEKEDLVCPECGEILNTGAATPAEGAESIRQGKRARMAIHDAAAKQNLDARRKRRSGASHATVEMPAVRDERNEEDLYGYTVSEQDAAYGETDGEEGVFERRRRTVYNEEDALEEQAAMAYTEWIAKGGKRRLQMVNWMKISFVLIILLVLTAVGTWLFLKKTDAGQKIMARLGHEASSSALWSVGEEHMNSGDVDGAIENFEKAKKQDEDEGLVDVDGLLMLGNAYEAAGRMKDAAALYEQIYTDTPSRTEAYVNHIRILMSGTDKDKAKAGELMKIAYARTGETSFQTQRRDLLPAPPEVDLTAGFYEQKKHIKISSYQGYDVYYTFDENAELPAGGTLYTERVFLDEGIHNLRAVAVNGALVSDELKGTYKIIMPSPQTPQCNLAPGAYKTRQKVRLKPGKDNLNDDDIVIYYTVDGSIPDADCPIYTGEPVQLPSGHVVTIKAVAVNKYNKVSNMLEVKYKIEAKPYPLTAWDLKETIAGLELNKTSMADFQAKYGEGAQVEMQQTGEFETECRKYEYSWGYAVMNLAKRNWVLVELYFKDTSSFKAPRNTGVGDPADYVVGQYKDLGQLESKSGNRGLYALDSGSDGKIWLQEDGTKILRYRIRNDGHWYMLEYYVNKGGNVEAVDWRYIP